MLKAASRRARHLTTGDRLGNYDLVRRIAVGTMAEIHLARASGIEGFEKLVVLKRILPQYVEQAAFVDMFLAEARLAATLHHPNVAQVYDIGGDDGDYFFAMEYVHGEDLEHVSVAAEEQGVPLSMDAALTLVAGLCAGLHYAHERTSSDGKPMGIVHRDVSPSNVIVSYDGAVKLVDFGIARAASRPGTMDGAREGKIAYMSPEQCRANAPLDRRSDVYSVGTILYELTTGKLPFAGESDSQLPTRIANEDVPPPTRIVPDYPAHLERIVLRALARDPDQRYATAQELQADVEAFAHDSRLRVSALVLARLMGTLFPARLEEWDHAKTQGGVFLEQHVVKALIESGKAAEPDTAFSAEEETVLTERMHPEAIVAGAQARVEDVPDGARPPPELTATSVGATPITFTRPDASFPRGPLPTYERTDSAGEPLPPPPTFDMRIDVPAPPEPEKPNPYPVVTELMSATPGALVTAAGKYGGMPKTIAGQRADPTERVRHAPRRIVTPTAFVRIPAKGSTILIGLFAAGIALAAFIALRPVHEPRAAAADVERRKQLPVVEPEIVEPPSTVAAKSERATEDASVEADAAPTSPATATVDVDAKATTPKRAATRQKPVVTKRKQRPAPKKQGTRSPAIVRTSK